MFIKTNDRLVNLENVSNINILPHEKRIVFNLDYSIEIIQDGELKYISDYVYWDLIDDANFKYALEVIGKNVYIHANFIPHEKGFINRHEISSIKFSDKKNRVIFNLSHPVTFMDFSGHSRITSEYVYVDFKNYGDYSAYADLVENTLITKG